MNKIPPRLPFFILVGLVAIVFFSAFINTYVFQSNAAQSKLSVQFSPQSGTTSDGSFNIVLKPDTTTDKISGADIVLTVQNGTISSWLPCKPLEEGKTPQIQTLLERTGASARYSCVILDKDENLVSGLVLSGLIQCAGSNPVTVTLDTQKSQVSGPVEGSQYAFNTVQNVTYNCSASGTPTVTPITSPTPAADIQAQFEPTTCRGGKGSACNYNLTIKSSDNTKKISAYYVKMNYDKTILKGKSISGPAGVKGLLAQGAAPTTHPGATTPAPGLNPNPGAAATATPPPGGLPTLVPTTMPSGRSCTTDQDCFKFCAGLANCAQTIFCKKDPSQPTGTCQLRSDTGAPTPTGGILPPGPTTLPQPTGPLPVPQPPVESTCSVVNTNINNEAGTMEILFVCDGSSSELKTSLTNTLVFDAIAEGEGPLTITDIQVVGPQAGAGIYTVDKGSARYVIGKGEGNVEAKLKLRMQGITKKPSKRDSMQVKIGLGDGGLEEPIFKTVEFKSDDNGHFNGTAGFNVPPRKDYKLLVKCEHCMQRKICDRDAKESEAGRYSCDKGKIELKNGANTFDFTGLVQLACDVPAGSQDGVCNSADFALVRNLLGKSEDDAVRKGDLNFDGIVNAVDFSIMTASYLVHSDQQ